jgi:hypothetical protein
MGAPPEVELRRRIVVRVVEIDGCERPRRIQQLSEAFGLHAHAVTRPVD